jgi:hypothetical protein
MSGYWWGVVTGILSVLGFSCSVCLLLFMRGDDWIGKHYDHGEES